MVHVSKYGIDELTYVCPGKCFYVPPYIRETKVHYKKTAPVRISSIRGSFH